MSAATLLHECSKMWKVLTEVNLDVVEHVFAPFDALLQRHLQYVFFLVLFFRDGATTLVRVKMYEYF